MRTNPRIIAAIAESPVAGEMNSARGQAIVSEPRVSWASFVKWVKSVFVVKLEAEWNARSHPMLGTPGFVRGSSVW